MHPLPLGRSLIGRYGSLSIFWKFALPTAALVAITGGVMIAVVYVQTTATLDSEMHVRVMARTRTMAAELDYLLASNAPSAAARVNAVLAAPVEAPRRLYAHVEDAAGALVASAGEVTPQLVAQIRQQHESSPSPMDAPMTPMDAPMAAHDAPPGMAMSRFTLEDGREVMDTAMPLGGGRILHSGHTLEQMRAVTTPVIAPLIGLLSIAPLVSLALIFLISRRLSAPLRELVRGAKKIQEGEYGGALKIRARDEIGSLAVAFNEMSAEVQRREAELRYNALHDRLTGLGNLALLEQRLDISLRLSGHYGAVVSLLVIDLDHFKKINDSFGHSAGDAVLVTAAERLARVVDEVGTVVRIGGDEFAVVLDASAEAAAAVAERIRAALGEPFEVGRHAIPLTASIGLTTSYEEQRAEDLLRQADLAMYAAKNDGRDRVRVYLPELQQAASDRMEIEEDLRQAIEQQALAVYYQAVVDLETGAPAGVEALVRWNHPTYGQLPPDRFIPVAEETGLIGALGEHVLRTALRDGRRWLDDFALDSFSLAVNVSGHQLQEPAFSDGVLRHLRDSGFPPSQLVIEITETVLVRQTEQARVSLETLRRAGVRIALDDFGTGYTSLEYLRSFPVDVIKIDRAFVTDLSRQPGNANIVRSILRLAEDFGAYVVAEGVESHTDAAFLRRLGCKLAQGYIFHRPAPEWKIRSLLRQGGSTRAGAEEPPGEMMREAS